MTEKTAAAAGDPKHRRVCFSFSAYAKAVIEHLRSAGVPVSAGLSDLEFAAIESSLRFEFPPELRSILLEGLPLGPGFPNWRSSSPHQLRLLLSLPISGLLNEISKGCLWPASFGIRPATTRDSVAMARGVLEKAPVLVPIYRHFYIPSSAPPVNGNPVFYLKGGTLRCFALDLADFFRRFRPPGRGKEGSPAAEGAAIPKPAWAAKSARRVETWSELVGDVAGEKGVAWRWKEMGWRLREAGWGEEEVREMLTWTEMDGGDEGRGADRMVLRDRDGVMWHVRLLALALLRAGWSTEDVVYCMGSTEEKRRGVTWRVDPADNDISMEP